MLRIVLVVVGLLCYMSAESNAEKQIEKAVVQLTAGTVCLVTAAIWRKYDND